MRPPPVWVWALPAALAAGVLLGARRTQDCAPAMPGRVEGSPRAAAAMPPGPPAQPQLIAPGTPVPAGPTPIDTAGWGPDGGTYQPLLGAAAPGDTLPSAPAGPGAEGAWDATPGHPAPPPRLAPERVAGGPAQELTRGAALARPLIASNLGSGRLSFYSAWDAPAERASLVGDWAAVGSCSATVRLGYEQAVPGLGAMRGAGKADRSPGWDVAIVVPRQHCTGAGAAWRAARAPRPDEAAALAPLLGGDLPRTVVVEGERVWAASGRRALVARLTAGRAVELWSEAAPDGASVRLLGRWQGEGVWIAVQPGGRIARVWRVG